MGLGGGTGDRELEGLGDHFKDIVSKGLIQKGGSLKGSLRGS